MRLATRASIRDPIAEAVSGVIEDIAGDIGLAEREVLAFVEGVLTAAAIGPERTSPHEWMRAVFQDRQFEDIEMAQASLALLSLMYNNILSDVRRMGTSYSPRFLDDAEDGEEIALAEHWASGFATGAQLRPEAWQALVRSQDARPVLVPIVVFLTQEDGTPLVARPAEFRREAVTLIGPAVYALYRYWKAHSRRSESALIDPLRKTGRNEPCPCGSGKKYKKCCLDRSEA